MANKSHDQEPMVTVDAFVSTVEVPVGTLVGAVVVTPRTIQQRELEMLNFLVPNLDAQIAKFAIEAT